MLAPIPAQIMRSTATVKVGVGMDLYKNPVYEEYTVNRVHLQPTNRIVKTETNTDVSLKSLLFADRRHSTPFDWWDQFNTAHELGVDMKVIVRGQEYTVFSVVEQRDDTDHFHHWEVGLM